MPPITLPITSRGLVVTDRVCWVLLGAAMVASAALILYLNRGTTLYLDELNRFYQSPGLDLAAMLKPTNGHLAVIPQLYYKGIFEAFGTDYVIVRVLHVATLALAVGLLYALIKRRIGALPALAPAFVLLFLGSAWNHVLVPQGSGIFLSIAAGLAALLALERDDRRGDMAACALVVVSIITFTIGLAFLVGTAISVLLREDRWRRAWMFLVPVALYAAWWLWASSQPQAAGSSTTLSNVLLIPGYVADSLATVTAALLGIRDAVGAGRPRMVDPGWGRVLAAATLVAVAVRIARGRVPRSLWVSLGVLLAYWVLGAIAFDVFRPPGSSRYIFMGCVGLVLVAADAARSVRFSGLGLIALFAVCAVGLAGNIASLRDAGAYFRNYAALAGTQWAMLELARGHVDPDFDPTEAGVPTPFALGARAGDYYASADEYGSLAHPLPDVEAEAESVRANGDLLLATALELRLGDAGDARTSGCRRYRSAGGAGAVELELPRGGARIRAVEGGTGKLLVGRFADAPSVGVGRLAAGEARALRIPTDSATRPWRATTASAGVIEVCALR